MSARPELGATRPPPEQHTSPYGRPVIKAPVWTWEVPAYFYVGGLAGTSAWLALLSDLRGDDGVARRAWATALVGSLASPVLLISDLGVPRRFFNMLRVFRITSPMSVGSWILAGFGTTTAPAALHALSGGRLGLAGRGAQVASALLGLPLAAYTGALVSNTAVPVWHHARYELPFVFTAGAMMSTGAMATMLAPLDEAQAPRRLALGGAVAELIFTETMEQRLRGVLVGRPYHEPGVRTLTRAAKGLVAAGAAVIAADGARSRAAAVVGGALLTGGAVAERFAVWRAGAISAARPQDSIDPQRAKIERGERRGAARAEPHRPAAPDRRDGHRPGERPVLPGSPALPS